MQAAGLNVDQIPKCPLLVTLISGCTTLGSHILQWHQPYSDGYTLCMCTRELTEGVKAQISEMVQ